VTKWSQKFLIILILAALVCLPPLGTGYFQLWQASTTADPGAASKSYETAAILLFWRPDLYEKAGLLAGGEPQRAIQLLTTAREHGSLSTNGQVSLAEAYLANGQTNQAVELLQSLLSTNQEISRVGPLLTKYYWDREQFDESTRALQHWLAADPHNPQASQQLGLILAAQAAPEAVQLLQAADAFGYTDLINALGVPGGQAYRLVRCGQALANINEWRLAEQAFSRATAVDGTYAEAWAWLGLARQHNSTSGGQQAVQNAIKLNGQSAAIRVIVGTYYQQNGNPAEAVTQFKTATRLEPGNPAWWAALGSAAAQSDLSVALNAYIQAVNLAPDQAVYWYALAAFCVERNAYIDDYGLNAALRAYALEPDNPLYMDMLGRTQTTAGMYQPAEVMLKKALAAAGSTPLATEIHLHLGLLYLQNSRNDLSKFELEQTVTLDRAAAGPYGSQAQKLLERYFP